jgi:hypothetical protein
MACLKVQLRFYVQGTNRTEDNDYYPLAVAIVQVLHKKKSGKAVPVKGHEGP